MASTESMDMNWANSGRWRETGRPGVLQSIALQRVGYNLAIEQQQQISKKECY